MKCPICAKKDMISKVVSSGSSVTSKYCEPFYDQNNVYHIHDTNIRSEHFTCSLGHAWTVTKTGTCPACDFGKNSEKIIITRDSENQNIHFI